MLFNHFKLVEIALQKAEFSYALVRCQSIKAYLAMQRLIDCNKHSFRAEKDGGYEHVPPSSLF